MRAIVLAGILTMVVLPAQAINRYNVNTMQCRDVQTIVQQQGAAILRYPSKRVQGMTLYDRYVANSGWCEPGEWAKPGWVPTADRAKCPVRHCEDIDYWDDGRFRRY